MSSKRRRRDGSTLGGSPLVTVHHTVTKLEVSKAGNDLYNGTYVAEWWRTRNGWPVYFKGGQRTKPNTPRIFVRTLTTYGSRPPRTQWSMGTGDTYHEVSYYVPSSYFLNARIGPVPTHGWRSGDPFQAALEGRPPMPVVTYLEGGPEHVPDPGGVRKPNLFEKPVDFALPRIRSYLSKPTRGVMGSIVATNKELNTVYRSKKHNVMVLRNRAKLHCVRRVGDGNTCQCARCKRVALVWGSSSAMLGYTDRQQEEGLHHAETLHYCFGVIEGTKPIECITWPTQTGLERRDSYLRGLAVDGKGNMYVAVARRIVTLKLTDTDAVREGTTEKTLERSLVVPRRPPTGEGDIAGDVSGDRVFAVDVDPRRNHLYMTVDHPVTPMYVCNINAEGRLDTDTVVRRLTGPEIWDFVVDRSGTSDNVYTVQATTAAGPFQLHVYSRTSLRHLRRLHPQEEFSRSPYLAVNDDAVYYCTHRGIVTVLNKSGTHTFNVVAHFGGDANNLNLYGMCVSHTHVYIYTPWQVAVFSTDGKYKREFSSGGAKLVVDDVRGELYIGTMIAQGPHGTGERPAVRVFLLPPDECTRR